MICTPHAKFVAPSFRAATDPAAQPFACAVRGEICKSPIYRPPPPAARGFQPLSGFANADSNPAQNARRSDKPLSAYAGHHAFISAGTAPAKAASWRATAAKVAPVHTAASGRASQPIATCASSLVRSTKTPPEQAESAKTSRHSIRRGCNICSTSGSTALCGVATSCGPPPAKAR